MTTEIRDWYQTTVLRFYARCSEWSHPQPVPAIQPALCDIPRHPARPLFIQRQRVDRLFTELCEFTHAAHQRAFAFSIHTVWIKQVLDLLDAAPNDWPRYRYEALRLLKKDDLSHIYEGERADIREIARRLRNYSRAMRCLAEVEARRMP